MQAPIVVIRAVALAGLFASTMAVSQANAENPMRGAAAIVAALHMAQECDGNFLRGHTDEGAFIQWASAPFKGTENPQQAVLKRVYHPKRPFVPQATNQLLSSVGVSLEETSELCRHARKGAGRNEIFEFMQERN